MGGGCPDATFTLPQACLPTYVCRYSTCLGWAAHCKQVDHEMPSLTDRFSHTRENNHPAWHAQAITARGLSVFGCFFPLPTWGS